ncbi:MAG: LamG domain-containing protein [Candidatus Brocadiae bacterium]|nr:LamG domain-containing protein [Candidatus Brocadiia bacterium]
MVLNKLFLCLLLVGLSFANGISLIGKWGFEEGSGTTAYNTSANSGLNGSIVNGSYTAGLVGSYALDFNGSSTYVEINNPGDILTPRTIGISLWYKARSGQQTSTCILDKGHGAGSSPYYAGYAFQYDGSGSSFSTFYGNGSTFTGFSTGGNQKDSQWHHVVANLGESEMSLYLDGVLISKTAGAGPLVSNDAKLYLGRHRALGRFFNGLIDEVEIYSGALTQNDVNVLYNMGDPMVPELSSVFFLGFALLFGTFCIRRKK